jgi:hypothetical protein
MSIDNASPKEWTEAGRRYFREPDGDWSIPEPESTPIKTLGDYVRTKQIAGNHYKSKIEPWDVFLDWGLDPWACNVIKYVQRHRKKAGKEDLEKAKHYLEFMISNYDTISGKYYK